MTMSMSVPMSATLKLEEVALFALSIIVFSTLPFAWWWFPALLLVPDIAMLGYLINPRVGAFCYNLGHHRALGLVVYGIGFLMGNAILLLIGVILFGHSAFDRIWGYGLKYASGFRQTHLGILPEPKSKIA
jgi:hypothetical protein